MGYIHIHRVWTGIFVAVVLMGLQGCASFETDEDRQRVAMQREIRRISRAHATTHQTMQDVYGRLHALESRVDGMGNTVEALARPPQPQPPEMLPGEKPSPSDVVQETPTTEAKTGLTTAQDGPESAPEGAVSETKVKKAADALLESIDAPGSTD